MAAGLSAARADTRRLIDASDVEELVRHIDRVVDLVRDEPDAWAHLLELAQWCRAAAERGRQLWPAGDHAHHRVALGAPGPLAVAALAAAPDRFGLGPLTEVVASTHTWDELAPALQREVGVGPIALAVAHERVVRGDDLRGDPFAEACASELPLQLAPWEPRYATPTYRAFSVEDEAQPLPSGTAVALPAPPPGRTDGPVAVAWRAAFDHWARRSAGVMRTVEVDGGPDDALAAWHHTPPVTCTRAALAGGDAIAAMAAAMAGGGVHGRRRGAAAGWEDAWWVAASIAGLDWPADPTALGEAVAELSWWVWDADDRPARGQWARLVVHDPLDGLAWALSAVDAG